LPGDALKLFFNLRNHAAVGNFANLPGLIPIELSARAIKGHAAIFDHQYGSFVDNC
jgi:predicted hotdog family 3-hydroxylacyl-ACP dehydratase